MKTTSVFRAHDETTGDELKVAVDDRGALVLVSIVENRERVLVLASPETGRRLARALAEALELHTNKARGPARRRSSRKRKVTV